MYQIKSWAATFENAESRKLSSLKWYKEPTCLRSNGQMELDMLGADGLISGSVFIKLCKWTAANNPFRLRGKLCRTDGTSLSLDQIAIRVNVDPEIMSRAIAILSSPSIGWIEIVPDPVKSAHVETEVDIEPPYNPAIDYSSPPEVLPIDVTQPIPFGIETDAIQQCDWMRIEAAFLAVWNATKGTIANRAKGMHSDAQRLFATRCCEPGWLVDAATALSKFPLKCMTGAMRLQNFLAPETVSAINAGNYSFDKSKPASLFNAVDNSKGVIESSMRATKELDAANKARKAREATYRKRLAERWGADAGLLTDKQITELDQLLPDMGLYSLYLESKKKTCRDSMRSLFTAILHECMEQQSGGKSFKETEENQ